MRDKFPIYVRKAEASDLRRLTFLFSNKYSSLLLNECILKEQCLVATLEEKIFGGLIYSPTTLGNHIDSISIHSEYQSEGFASHLLTFLEKISDKRVFCYIPESKKELLEFFKKKKYFQAGFVSLKKDEPNFFLLKELKEKTIDHEFETQILDLKKNCKEGISSILKRRLNLVTPSPQHYQVTQVYTAPIQETKTINPFFQF